MPLRKTQDLLVFYESVRNRCSCQQMKQLIYVLQRLNADKIRGMEVYDELSPYFAQDPSLKDEFALLFIKEYSNVPASMKMAGMGRAAIASTTRTVAVNSKMSVAAIVEAGSDESELSAGGSCGSSLVSLPIREESSGETSPSGTGEEVEDDSLDEQDGNGIGRIDEMDETVCQEDKSAQSQTPQQSNTFHELLKKAGLWSA